MNLGAFSTSLTVGDIAASRDFYAGLGFSAVAGNADENWLILRNGDCTIGIFKGMFDRNMLTFNPGWVSEDEVLEDFIDIREIHARLQAAGIALDSETNLDTTGPASMILTDPDGNPILIDQHVPAPGAG